MDHSALGFRWESVLVCRTTRRKKKTLYIRFYTCGTSLIHQTLGFLMPYLTTVVPLVRFRAILAPLSPLQQLRQAQVYHRAQPQARDRRLRRRIRRQVGVLL